MKRLRVYRKIFRILLYLFAFSSIFFYFYLMYDTNNTTNWVNLSINRIYWEQRVNGTSRFNATLQKHISHMNLWRPTDDFTGLDKPHYYDRFVEQDLWARNLRPTKKKRIALPGGFGSLFCTHNDIQNSLRQNCPNLLDYCDYIDSSSIAGDEELSGVDIALFNFAYVRNVPKGNYKRAYLLLEPIYKQATYLSGTDLFCAFWSGSDIPYPYGKWVNYEHLEKANTEKKKNYAEGKSKLAAMFTSNCGARNGRLEFVAELKNYGVSVEIYGGCGTFSCPRYIDRECYSKLKTDYKFYFAFENNNCRDYITEKFFRNALENDAVPVIMGAPLVDFQAAAPPNSYIHVDTFGSIEALAKYLLFLDKNDAEYNKYFEWKGTGELVDPNFYCRFCGMLYYGDIVPAPVRTKTLFYNVDDLEKMNEPLCLKPKVYYWDHPTLQ